MNKKIITTLLLTTTLTTNVIPVITHAKTIDLEDKFEESNPLEDEDIQEPTMPTPEALQSKKLIITSVSCDKEIIEAGDEFTLTYNVKNNTTSRIDNVALQLSAVEGESFLVGFTPKNTTNEIYLGTISGHDTRKVSITLIASETLKPNTYNFITNVSYNKPNQPQEGISKLSGIVISTKPDVDIIDTEVMSFGEEGYVQGTIINDSEKKIKNAIVTVNYNGLKHEEIIGNIDGENEKPFNISLPLKDTTKEVEIIVSFEDSKGVTHSFDTLATVLASNPNEIPTGLIPPVEEKKGFWGWLKSLFGFGNDDATDIYIDNELPSTFDDKSNVDVKPMY